MLALEKSSLAASRRRRRTFLYSFSLAGNFRVPGARGEPKSLPGRSRAGGEHRAGRVVSCTGALLLSFSRTVLALPGAGEDPVEQEEVTAGSGRDGAVLQPFCSEGWAAWGSSFLLTESREMILTRLHPWKFSSLRSHALTHDPVYSGLVHGAFSERKDFFSGHERHLSHLLEVFTP